MCSLSSLCLPSFFFFLEEGILRSVGPQALLYKKTKKETISVFSLPAVRLSGAAVHRWFGGFMVKKGEKRVRA